MHCCLLVSKKDSKLIQDKEFDKLQFGLREIIKALSKSKSINKISLGAIHLEKERSKLTFNLIPSYKKLIRKIDTLFFRVSKLIDSFDARLNRYTLKTNQLQRAYN